MPSGDTKANGIFFRSGVLAYNLFLSLDDHAVLQWVEQHAIKHTIQEKEQWAASLVQSFFEPTPEMISYLTRVYPKLTEFIDRNTLDSSNPFGLIDYDKGRIPFSEVLQRRK